jgi:ATP-dependent exoDNAse (exonuclease V) beta subunit
MTKDEMLKVLKDSFKDFKFYEDGHYYECKGKRVGVSVTTFIHEYCNEFDEIGQAEKTLQKNIKNYNYARQQLHIYYGDIKKDNLMREYLKLPLTIEDILKEWHYKRDFSCEKGTTCHELIQSLWSGEKWALLPFDGSAEYLQAVNKIQKQANQFRIDYNDILENLIVELPIGSEEFDIASCVDNLFYNKLTGGLVLVDYKTNTDIYKDKKYYKNTRKKPSKMKVPLQHLEDLTITHYYIQLSIYKFLIEKYTGLKVDEMFIVYMSENIENYEIIEIPYLKDEVEKILEWRKWE